MVTPAHLWSLFEDIERQQDKVLTVWLHPEEYRELLKHPSILTLLDREQIGVGFCSMIWGVNIQVDPRYRVFLETERGAIGRLSRWDVIGR